MDMEMFRKKRRMHRMKHAAEMGDESAREALNRSGFNRTPTQPAKSPTLTAGEPLMKGHDVMERNDIPQGSDMYNMRAKTGSAPPDKAGLIPFEKQSDALKQNYQPQPKPMRKRIFARDPNYNPEPTTPAPNGPGTKQTDMAAGRPGRSLAEYRAGGPGGEGEGSVGPMRTVVGGANTSGPTKQNFSHRNQELPSQGAPSGPGDMQTKAATGTAQRSLAHYPGGSGGKAGMQGGMKTMVAGHPEAMGEKHKKRKLSRRGMAFVGRSGPGNYQTGSPA